MSGSWLAMGPSFHEARSVSHFAQFIVTRTSRFYFGLSRDLFPKELSSYAFFATKRMKRLVSLLAASRTASAIGSFVIIRLIAHAR